MICDFGFRTRTCDALVLLLLDIFEGFCYIEIRSAFYFVVVVVTIDIFFCKIVTIHQTKDKDL